MKKTIIAIISIVLVCCCVIGSTYAWLMDKSETVTNTFTFGNIDITLTETKGDGSDTAKSFKMIPGASIEKNPVVTVAKESEACWLFIKIEEINNTFGNPAEKFITYALADGWTCLVDAGNIVVYYREVAYDKDNAQEFHVFKNDEVTANSNITKAAVDGITTNAPQLVLTAYAVQKEAANDSEKTPIENAASAWLIANP